MTRLPPLFALSLLAVSACQQTPSQTPSTIEAPVAATRQAVASAPRGTQVWVNTASGVYHCPNSSNYGATQEGEYMGERAAMAAGYRPARDQGCNDAREGVKVWVNTTSGVYHCPHTQWYGKTADGEFMPERDARAKGFEPAKGVGCAAS